MFTNLPFFMVYFSIKLFSFSIIQRFLVIFLSSSSKDLGLYIFILFSLTLHRNDEFIKTRSGKDTYTIWGHYVNDINTVFKRSKNLAEFFLTLFTLLFNNFKYTNINYLFVLVRLFCMYYLFYFNCV